MLPLIRDGDWNLIRADINPIRDVNQLLPGDDVLVVTDAYDGDPEPKWCKVRRIVPGTATPYPIRVQVPGRGEGQYALAELLGWRRDVDFHRLLMELRRLAGLATSEEASIDGMMAT